MATLRDIKRRISSVQGTQQITRAMRMVAAAKLRRAQDNLMKARPYTDKLHEVIVNVAAHTDQSQHELLELRPAKSVCWVVVTGDRGLCGGFNNNLLRAAAENYNNTSDVEKSVIPVGKKARDFFITRDYPVAESYVEFFRELDFSHAADIGDHLMEQFLNGTYDRVVLVYNAFRTVITQDITVRTLLPLADEFSSTPSAVDYIFEPEPAQLLDTLLPQHVHMQIWRMLLESWASELGARMAAMENATDAADDMIASLTLQYNKTRQQTITKELSEIVGGAEALK
jgi:F-type H+-transporting ATPase subunit gamma